MKATLVISLALAVICVAFGAGMSLARDVPDGAGEHPAIVGLGETRESWKARYGTELESWPGYARHPLTVTNGGGTHPLTAQVHFSPISYHGATEIVATSIIVRLWSEYSDEQVDQLLRELLPNDVIYERTVRTSARYWNGEIDTYASAILTDLFSGVGVLSERCEVGSGDRVVPARAHVYRGFGVEGKLWELSISWGCDTGRPRGT